MVGAVEGGVGCEGGVGSESDVGSGEGGVGSDEGGVGSGEGGLGSGELVFCTALIGNVADIWNVNGLSVGFVRDGGGAVGASNKGNGVA